MSDISVNPYSTPNPTYPNMGIKTPTGMKTAAGQKGKMKIPMSSICAWDG